MHYGTYLIAGHCFSVVSIFRTVQELCRDYRCDDAPEFTIEITREDLAFERKKSDAELAMEGYAPIDFGDDYLETLAVYRKLAVKLLEHDVLLLHGSVVAVGEKAYLFTASSGTGKTTHTRLWLKNIPGAFVLNGDKPLLALTPDGVLACGTPWQGKENLGRNLSLPLQAICILERDAVNHIEKITMHQALPMLMQQSYRPKEAAALMKTMELVGRLGKSVSLYRLGCNMEDEAAFVAYDAMR